MSSFSFALDTSAARGSADEFADGEKRRQVPEAEFERLGEGLRPAGPAGGCPSGFWFLPAHAPFVGARELEGAEKSHRNVRRRTTNSQLSSLGGGGADAESSAVHDLFVGLGARWTLAPNDTGVMPVICRAIAVGASTRVSQLGAGRGPARECRPPSTGAVARPSLARSGKAGLARPGRPRCACTLVRFARRRAQPRRIDAGLPTGLASRDRIVGGAIPAKGVHFLGRPPLSFGRSRGSPTLTELYLWPGGMATINNPSVSPHTRFTTGNKQLKSGIRAAWVLSVIRTLGGRYFSQLSAVPPRGRGKTRVREYRRPLPRRDVRQPISGREGRLR